MACGSKGKAGSKKMGKSDPSKKGEKPSACGKGGKSKGCSK